LLLSRGASVNYTNWYNQSALYWAAGNRDLPSSKMIPVVNILFEYGADADSDVMKNASPSAASYLLSCQRRSIRARAAVVTVIWASKHRLWAIPNGVGTIIAKHVWKTRHLAIWHDKNSTI
jgi:ankyrin repeat protein